MRPAGEGRRFVRHEFAVNGDQGHVCVCLILRERPQLSIAPGEAE
jgi:hypothetical protein